MPHYMTPLASSIISNHTPLGPSYDRLAELSSARAVELPLVTSCQSFMHALGLRCLPEGGIVRAGFSLMVASAVPHTFFW